jgi:hypothetical protein
VVNATPAAPGTTPITYCQNTSAAALTATTGTGNSLRWYTNLTGGTASTTAPVPGTVATGVTNYYVSQVTTAGCEGPRATIAVTVNATPAAPTATSPVAYCLNDLSQYLSATVTTGNTLNWYNTPTGGVATSNVPKPFTGVAGNTNYYVSQYNSFNCESPRAVIAVTVNALPTPPVIAAAPTTKLIPGATTTVSLSGTPAGGSTFSWFRNGVLINGQNGSSTIVDINKLGTYSMQLTNSANCSANSNNIVISGAENANLFVYPNPTNGMFKVRFYSDGNNLQPRKMTISNILGEVVYKASYAMFGAYTPMDVDLTGKASGYYTIRLMDADGKDIISTRIYKGN